MKTEINIKGEPNIDLEMSPYWHAFWELNDFRPVNGYGITPIAKDEIVKYARENFYDDEETMDLISIIKMMDIMYRQAQHDKAEQKMAQQKASQQVSRRRR